MGQSYLYGTPDLITFGLKPWRFSSYIWIKFQRQPDHRSFLTNLAPYAAWGQKKLSDNPATNYERVVVFHEGVRFWRHRAGIRPRNFQTKMVWLLASTNNVNLPAPWFHVLLCHLFRTPSLSRRSRAESPTSRR